jgi:2-oxoglutarate ferredoxin oxidoreductase subunit gamma
MKHVELRLAGEGGQGLILGSVILAEAAAVHDGYNAVQTQSYGPESRGGASKAEVIIAEGEIDYPKVQSPDFVLVMSQEAADKYSKDVKASGTLVVDSSMIKNTPKVLAKTVLVPITEIARDQVGREIVANIVGLGVLVGVTGVVTRDALTKAVMARVPKGTEALNQKALEAGFAIAKQYS